MDLFIFLLCTLACAATGLLAVRVGSQSVLGRAGHGRVWVTLAMVREETSTGKPGVADPAERSCGAAGFQTHRVRPDMAARKAEGPVLRALAGTGLAQDGKPNAVLHLVVNRARVSIGPNSQT